MKKQSVLRWTLHLMKPWIPALILLVLCNVLSAVFTVWFSLGYREVIDSATGADWHLFKMACLKQGVLIAGIVHGMQSEVPGGDSRFVPGDRVVVVTGRRGMLRQLGDIFA